MDHAWVQVGQVRKPHGIHGDLRVTAWGGGMPDAIDTIRLVSVQGATVQFPLKQLREIPDGWLLSLEGLTCPEEAAAWRHASVEIRAEQIEPPEPGEFYLYELIGTKVITQEGDVLGTAEYLLDNQGQNVLAIKSQAGERLLPIVPEFVTQLDRQARTLHVRVPAGFWDELPS